MGGFPSVLAGRGVGGHGKFLRNKNIMIGPCLSNEASQAPPLHPVAAPARYVERVYPYTVAIWNAVYSPPEPEPEDPQKAAGQTRSTTSWV